MRRFSIEPAVENSSNMKISNNYHAFGQQTNTSATSNRSSLKTSSSDKHQLTHRYTFDQYDTFSAAPNSANRNNRVVSFKTSATENNNTRYQNEAPNLIRVNAISYESSDDDVHSMANVTNKLKANKSESEAKNQKKTEPLARNIQSASSFQKFVKRDPGTKKYKSKERLKNKRKSETGIVDLSSGGEDSQHSDVEDYEKKKNRPLESIVHPQERIDDEIEEIRYTFNDFSNENYFQLLESDKMKFLFSAPRKGLVVKCRVCRKTGLFDQYIMLLETKDEQHIPLMISRRKKASIKSYNWIDLIVGNKDLGKDQTYMEIGKLKAQNKLTFVVNEFALAKLNTFVKEKKNSEINGSNDELIGKEQLRIKFDNSLFKVSQPVKISLQLDMGSLKRRSSVCVSNNEISEEDENFNYSIQLKNKEPLFEKTNGTFLLDFQTRVLKASRNNFQIISENEPDNVLLQVGKFMNNVYVCDFKYPFNAFQSFGIILSSLSRKFV